MIKSKKIKLLRKEKIEWFKYKPEIRYINSLNNSIGTIGGVSVEGYLYYNDLLAQNEDCKYYYRDVVENGGEWNPKSGRRNTLLTHISVISFLLGNMKFSEIMDHFQHYKGVAPISEKNISIVTNGFVEIKK